MATHGPSTKEAPSTMTTSPLKSSSPARTRSASSTTPPNGSAPPPKKQRGTVINDDEPPQDCGAISSDSKVTAACTMSDMSAQVPSLQAANSSASVEVVEDRSSLSNSMEQKPPADHSDSANLNEESFLAWLLDQKKQGVGAGQMLDALGLGVSDGIAVDDDDLWDAMISMGIRLVQPSIPARQKLPHVNTLHDVVSLLRSARKIIVLAGAGISVSCGIPDFRSENGIYSRLAEYDLPNPQCMFDIEFFRTNPRPFFAFAKELFPKANGFTFVPSASHYFLRLLEDKGKLLRIYSQNIDMLERAAGISHEHCVLCHGSFETATCLACTKIYPSEAIREDVMKQQVPMCSACNAENGIVKPDIVFFGESLPRRFHDCIRNDENEADLVLVMGSSLKVNPVRSVVGRINTETPMVLINREPVGRPHRFDVELLGYSDEIVVELCRQLEWDLPTPDPELLRQSGLSDHVESLDRVSRAAPLQYEFVAPCRHMFNGSKASASSSEDGDYDGDEQGSSSSSSAQPDHMPMDEVEVDHVGRPHEYPSDCHPLGLSSGQEDEHLMATGNVAHQVENFLGTDSFGSANSPRPPPRT